MEDNNYVLELQNIRKLFPGVTALDDITFGIKRGEVHVLLGENGAGKSTLVKIISGVYQKDSGEMLFESRKIDLRGVKDAQELGISIIHQELNVLPQRSIAQNIYLGREPIKNRFLNRIDDKKMYRDSFELLKSLDIDLDPDTPVKNLGIAQQQMVEVVKALSIKTKLLIMDEPTSTLTQREIDNLFKIIDRLKRSGVSIIYISHRIEEIKRVGDKVTVLRDGRYVGTVDARDAEIDDLITMMVGRKISQLYKRDYNEPGEEVLKTENLSSLRFRNVSINVHKGEIVGLAGLVGSGRTEVMKSIYGYDPIDSGRVYYFGKEVKKPSPKKSVKNGMGFLPEDRKGEGLILQMPVKNNIVHASLSRLFKHGFIDKSVEYSIANKYKSELRIVTPDVNREVKALSGGNQQKVVLAKWLCTKCKVFIFDEPTRGIDVGAKAEIYELMNELAKNGAAILIVSSDQKEVLGLCDRIYVMCEGRIMKEFKRGEATPELIVGYAIGKGGEIENDGSSGKKIG